jgi:hypothetical protein
MNFWVFVFIRTPVPDCWCGDDIHGDSGTVPDDLPGKSVSHVETCMSHLHTANITTEP